MPRPVGRAALVPAQGFVLTAGNPLHAHPSPPPFPAWHLSNLKQARKLRR